MSDPARTPLAELDPVEAWKPWQPDAAHPWDRKWAGHLFRRAAFGASWPRLEAAVRDGPEATVQALFTGGPGHEDFDELMDALAPFYLQEGPPNNPQNNVSSQRLQGWWLYRMILTPHPLREKLTLFWHNHFATSIVKVRQPALMLRQNALLREHALGKFGPFLLDVSRDPAMLIWLDSNSNVKSHPNENYAREVMELFSLGTGHYTEHDVREAARAFTGWHTGGNQFRFDRFQHDDGPKTVLGQTGNWDGGDVIRILLEQPACARFLVRKLYRHFVSEAESPPDRLLEPLAERLRRTDYDVGDVLGIMLRARHFFSAYAYRQRIKSPAEYVVGLFRSFGVKPEGEGGVDNGTGLALPAPLDPLGQILFAPPNVKGWDGGRAWLNTATLLARHNFAWKFLQGAPGSLGARVDLPGLVREYAGGAEPARRVDFLLGLLLQGGDVPPAARRKLVEFLSQGSPDGPGLERRLRETAHTILLMPESQLA